jgi:hypothetical protein
MKIKVELEDSQLQLKDNIFQWLLQQKMCPRTRLRRGRIKIREDDGRTRYV